MAGLVCRCAIAIACANIAAASVAAHPRLILTPSRLQSIAGFVANNTQAASYARNLTLQAD
jgi:hypothetical protein